MLNATQSSKRSTQWRHPLLHSHPRLVGVVLALLSTGLFTLVAVLVKHLSGDIDVFQILFFRQLVFFIVLLPSIHQNIHTLMRPKNTKLHALRIIGAFTALSLGFVTVSNIPLADATALGFTQVLFVAVISRLCLAESLTISRKLTILIGFVGVVLVVQPRFEYSEMQFIGLGIVGAFGAAVAVICVRKVAQTEPKISLLAYQAFFVGLFAFFPSLSHWVWPSALQLLLLVGVGVLSSIAQWVGITAYKYAEANIVANVEYAKIIYSLLLGYILFSETPNHLAILGAIVIISSPFVSVLTQTVKKSI